MKKTLLLFLVITLGWVSNARAQVQMDKIQRGIWFLQLNGTDVFPTGHLADGYNAGWGGEGSIGFHFPDQVELSLETGFNTFGAKNNANNASWNMLPLALKAQFAFTHGWLRPYVFGAAGLAFNSRYANFGTFTGNNTEADLLTEAGAGLSFYLQDNSIVFIQGKVELDNTSSAYAEDVPTVLIPLNAGIKFALN